MDVELSEQDEGLKEREVVIDHNQALQLIATQLCAVVHNIKDKKKAVKRMNMKREEWMRAAKITLVWAQIIHQHQIRDQKEQANAEPVQDAAEAESQEARAA